MIMRAALYAAFLLYLTLGATYSGIILTQTRWLGMVGVTLIAIAWIGLRTLRRWRWHATALDGVILLWLGAFALSLIANAEMWRRIVMGLWYVVLYIGVWLLLHDLLAHRVISRRVLFNALLLSGVLVIVFGYLQLRGWLVETLPLMLNGTLPLSLPRPVSTMGNPNTLGAFLIVLVAPALEAARSARRFGRVLLSVYALLLIGLVVLTYSRGAWLGMAAGVALQVGLLLWLYDWLSPARWRAWWREQRVPVRAGVVIAGAAVLLVGLAGAFVIARTFLTPGGRSGDTRTWIYEAALQAFAAQPIAGSGLFTFGADLARFTGSPPSVPHTHAHNIVLHIAAELGVIGLIAFAATVWFSGRAMWRSLMISRDPTIIAGVGGIAAFAVHHLFDVPSMTPAVALAGLTALVIAAAPVEPIPFVNERRWAGILKTAGVTVGVIALVITGWRGVTTYQQYVSILSQAANDTLSYADAARELQAVIDADPALAVYHHQQGLLFALAGQIDASIAAFERFTALEPDTAIGWLNLFALYDAAGERDQAFDAVTRAVEVSPFELTALYQRGQYLETQGEDAAAREMYLQALTVQPDMRLLSDWDDSPLRVSILDDAVPLTDAAQVLLLLEAGDVSGARALWDASPYRLLIFSQSSAYVIDLLLALHEGDHAAAAEALSAAGLTVQGTGDVAWARYGAGCLAAFDGDDGIALDWFASARAALILEPFQADWIHGESIAYGQFIRQSFPRQFVPQLDYPLVSPLLVYLLDQDEIITACP